MIKKLGHFILSGLLVTVIIGITVNMHYCGNQLYSFKINSQADKCCDNNQCGHCKDKSVVIKIHDDFLQVISEDLSTEVIPVHLAVPSSNDMSPEPAPVRTIHRTYASDISPPGAKQKLSLLQTYLL